MISRSTQFVVCGSAGAEDPTLTSMLAEHLDCVTLDAFAAPVPDWATQVLRVSPEISPTVVEVGLRVHERWRVQRGKAGLFGVDDGLVDLEYEVPAGSRQAFVRAFDSGQPADTVAVDRSLHLAEAVLECEYCETVTCSRCIDPAGSCVVCGVVRCGRCVEVAHPLPICAACSDLKPLGRRAARRRAGKRGRVLAGEDSIHSVEVVLPVEGPGVVEVRRGELGYTVALSHVASGYVEISQDFGIEWLGKYVRS